MRIAVIFHRFGPYHFARLKAAAHLCKLTGIELGSHTAEYEWDKVEGYGGFHRNTLFPEADGRAAKPNVLRQKLEIALAEAKPDVVAIPGWSDRAAFMALRWCAGRTPAIVMSESTAHDEPRVSWKEWIKRRIVKLYSTALVGGRLHKEYLSRLGMSPERIFFGYDVVDNDHFRTTNVPFQSKKEATHIESPVPLCSSLNAHHSSPYFLASARFIPKKNLPLLISAYALYRERYGQGRTERPSHLFQRRDVTPWPLVLLGDGPLRESLKAQVSSLSLQDHVRMPGFEQYDALPSWYAGAGAFVHASTSEQWGLVVNEALAAGVPVIVSNRCGCAPELVREGENGFTFDSTDEFALADRMHRIADLSEAQRGRMGDASRNIVANFSAKEFGHGLLASANLAMSFRPAQHSGFSRALLNLLALR